MSRPKLPEAINRINLYRSQGFKEADETMLDTSGEFVAGRFIIELCIEIERVLLKEKMNAKS